jgi:hypothetical protein
MAGEPPPAASGTKWEALGLTNYYFCLLENDNAPKEKRKLNTQDGT